MEKLAFIFPGQGSQKVGMGKDLYQEFSLVKDIYDEADAILGYPYSSLSFQGPQEKLAQTEYTQPAVLINSYAISSLLKEQGLSPTHAAGHSLGEYTALLEAKVFDFPEALRLVRLRGELMEKAWGDGQGTMAAILGLSRDKVKAICQKAKKKGLVVPANYNSPGQIVISGEVEGVKEAASLAEEMNAKRVIFLSVSGPFHSPLMEDAARGLDEKLSASTFQSPQIKVIANYNASYLLKKEDIHLGLVQQLVSPVLWEESMNQMIADGVKTFVEIGPGKVLKGLLRHINPEVKAFHAEDGKSFDETCQELKKLGLLS